MAFYGYLLMFTSFGCIIPLINKLSIHMSYEFPLRVYQLSHIESRKVWELLGSIFMLSAALYKASDLKDMQLAWIAYHHAYRSFNMDPYYKRQHFIFTIARSVLFSLYSSPPLIVGDHLMNILLQSRKAT